MPIVDVQGRPIMTAKQDEREQSEFMELGSTGLKQSSGYVHEEWHRRLHGRRGVFAYREMADNNAIVGAILFAIEMFVRQVETRVVPASESDPLSLEAATFVEECIDDMSITWDDFTAEVFSFLQFGWSYFEEVFKLRLGPDQDDASKRSKHSDGRIGWRKLAIRAQETLWKWEFDDDGGIRGMWQRDPYNRGHGPVLIPIEKSLLFRTKSHKNNPEGRSVLRNAYRSWFFLRRMQETEAIGIERDLAGYPVIRVPLAIMSPNANAEETALRALFEDMVVKIRRDEYEGVVFPASKDMGGNDTGYDIGLLNSGGRRQIDTNKIIERYEKRIATTMLHDWVLLGQDKVGSFALADSKTQASAMAVSGYLEQRDEVINRFAIPKLMKLNPEFPPGTWPTIDHGDIELPDLAGIADFAFKLASIGGLTMDRGMERFFRQVGSFPELDDAEPDLTPRSVPQIQVPALPGEAGAAVPGAEEGVKPGVAPEAEAVIDPSLALNGAQITALMSIVIAVSNKELPRDSALELIVAGFPITRERADKILGQIGREAGNGGDLAPELPI